MKTVYSHGPNRAARRLSRFKEEAEARMRGDGKAILAAIAVREFNSAYKQAISDGMAR